MARRAQRGLARVHCAGHPAVRHISGRLCLLPSFPGLHAQRQTVEYGSKFSGCTVHFVEDGIDTGPIIIQDVVKVKDDDTEESLSKRILAKEHKIYPEAVRLFAKGKIKVSGRRTIIKS